MTNAVAVCSLIALANHCAPREINLFTSKHIRLISRLGKLFSNMADQGTRYHAINRIIYWGDQNMGIHAGKPACANSVVRNAVTPLLCSSFRRFFSVDFFPTIVVNLCDWERFV